MKLTCKECGQQAVVLKLSKFFCWDIDFGFTEEEIELRELHKNHPVEKSYLYLGDTRHFHLYCGHCKESQITVLADGQKIDKGDLVVKFAKPKVVLPDIEIQLAAEMPREKIELIKRQEEARSEEGQRWIDKVVELAEKNGVPITDVEEYYTRGSSIRFAVPDQPEEEADVYVSYKQVECLTEFGEELVSLSRKEDKSFEKAKEVLRQIAEAGELLPGYTLENDGTFVKTVETPQEAIREVTAVISSIKDLETTLRETLSNLAATLEKARRQ